MLVADILNSCANDRVAAAAVASIGGEFAARLRAMARQHGTSVGNLAATLVQRFASHATERDWRRVTLKMSGSDLPLLCGFRAIVENRLDRVAIDLAAEDSSADAFGDVPAYLAGRQAARRACASA